MFTRKLKLRALVFAAIATGLGACAKGSYQAVNFEGDEQDLQKIPDDPSPYSRPVCEVEYWDQKMSLDLYSYELTGSNGINFGFNGGGLLAALGLNVKIDKAKLFIQAATANPYENESPYLASANDTDVSFGVNIDFGKIEAGFDHFSNTPVAALTRKGLVNSVEGMRDKIFSLPKYKREWSTRVLSTPIDKRDKVVIQAGADAGISEGDEFQVFNIDHGWRGEPCSSQYLGFEPTNGWDRPVAILRAERSVDSARQFAMLTITDPRISNQDILSGAYVRQVPAAKGKKLKTLARSIKVESITSGNLVLKDGRKIDLALYMKKQIADVLKDPKWKGQFYMHSQ